MPRVAGLALGCGRHPVFAGRHAMIFSEGAAESRLGLITDLVCHHAQGQLTALETSGSQRHPPCSKVAKGGLADPLGKAPRKRCSRQASLARHIIYRPVGLGRCVNGPKHARQLRVVHADSHPVPCPA